MNIEKHLILIKGEDKTEEIRNCEYENGKWQVVFVNNNKTYSYNYQNLQWLKNPVVLNPETTIVYQDNQPVSGVNKIFVFNNYIRICFVTGYKKVYHSREITLEQSCLKNPEAQNSFEYLKQLAEKVSLKDEEDSSFLSKQYEKITFISPNSVLAKYLYQTDLNKQQHRQMATFPFGFNLSQNRYGKLCLNKSVSLKVLLEPVRPKQFQYYTNAIINGKRWLLHPIIMLYCKCFENFRNMALILLQPTWVTRKTKEVL